MSTPDKPETPLSEKLQVSLATEMFDKGVDIKDGVREDFIATHQRDERGQAMSRVGAESAKATKQRVTAQRKKGKATTVDGGVDVKSAGIKATGKGGRSYGTEGEIVRRGTSTAERTARSMASKDHQSSMDEFVSDNERKQAILDLGMASASAYAYGKDNQRKKEAQRNRDEADAIRESTKVDPYSNLSAMNYDTTGMGA